MMLARILSVLLIGLMFGSALLAIAPAKAGDPLICFHFGAVDQTFSFTQLQNSSSHPTVTFNTQCNNEILVFVAMAVNAPFATSNALPVLGNYPQSGLTFNATWFSATQSTGTFAPYLVGPVNGTLTGETAVEWAYFVTNFPKTWTSSFMMCNTGGGLCSDTSSQFSWEIFAFSLIGPITADNGASSWSVVDCGSAGGFSFADNRFSHLSPMQFDLNFTNGSNPCWATAAPSLNAGFFGSNHTGDFVDAPSTFTNIGTGALHTAGHNHQDSSFFGWYNNSQTVQHDRAASVSVPGGCAFVTSSGTNCVWTSLTFFPIYGPGATTTSTITQTNTQTTTSTSVSLTTTQVRDPVNPDLLFDLVIILILVGLVVSIIRGIRGVEWPNG